MFCLYLPLCLCLDCSIYVVMAISRPTHEEKKHAKVIWIWPFKQINTVTRLESYYFYTYLYVIWPLRILASDPNTNW